jgi:cytosine/adenosine deaminase-related metal-dependent hydrolase
MTADRTQTFINSGPSGEPTGCDLLVRNGLIITVDAERSILADGGVAVRDGTIVAVGPDQELNRLFRATQVINANGAAVHPGFIDPHVHVSLHSTRGTFQDVDSGATPYRRWYCAAAPEDEYASALHCALEALRNGFTTLVDPGTIFEPDAVASAITEVGVRSSLADPFLWDLASAPDMERAPACSDRAMGLLGGQLKRNRDPKALARGHIALYGLGTASDALVLAAKQQADEAGVAFAMHQSFAAADTEADDVRLDRYPLVHYAEIGALGTNCAFVHMNVIRNDEIEPIVESGMSVVWHPGNFLFYAIASATPSRMVEIKERGANMALCVDVAKAWTFGDMGVFAYLVARETGAFVPPEAVFEMQTIGAAQAAGMREMLGSIEVGKRADLVIRNKDFGETQPDLDPIREIALVGRSKSVDTVIVDGKVVLRHGRAQLIEERKVWELANASARRLVERLELSPGPAWPFVNSQDS